MLGQGFPTQTPGPAVPLPAEAFYQQAQQMALQQQMQMQQQMPTKKYPEPASYTGWAQGQQFQPGPQFQYPTGPVPGLMVLMVSTAAALHTSRRQALG